MKYLYIFLFTGLGLFFFTSCKKEKEDPKFENKAKANINGSVSESTLGIKSGLIAANGSLTFTEFGYNFANHQRINLTFYNQPKVGSFTSGSSEAKVFYSDNYSNSPPQYYNPTSWSLNVTELSDKGVKGTFSFSGYLGQKTITITDGEFSNENRSIQ